MRPRLVRRDSKGARQGNKPALYLQSTARGIGRVGGIAKLHATQLGGEGGVLGRSQGHIPLLRLHPDMWTPNRVLHSTVDKSTDPAARIAQHRTHPRSRSPPLRPPLPSLLLLPLLPLLQVAAAPPSSPVLPSSPPLLLLLLLLLLLRKERLQPVGRTQCSVSTQLATRKSTLSIPLGTAR